MTNHVLLDPLLEDSPRESVIELLVDADFHAYCETEVCIRNYMLIVPSEAEAAA